MPTLHDFTAKTIRGEDKKLADYKGQVLLVVNVASEAGIRGSAAGLAYTASKHAVVGMTKSSAFMYTEKGIRFDAVAPGPVATNIQANFASELGQARIFGPAKEILHDPRVAELFLGGLAHD